MTMSNFTPQHEGVCLCRVHLIDMAEHPEGLDLSKEQLVIVVCSTQVLM